jgi:FMN phosphatase YigB (HAD superfamily)
MNITVLFDLDDTLIKNDMAVFQPSYFKLLSNHLSEIPSENLMKYLWAGTRAMISKDTPVFTLAKTFNKIFYSGLGIEQSDYIQRLNDFYLRVFPQLQNITSPIPGAVQLIEWILENQGSVAIATNPLFPRLAILERLRWAKLPADKYPFALIPSFETFHFAKPNPSFFAEFLSQLGWTEQPIVMVGNDLEQDIFPAISLGIPVYWISDIENSTIKANPLNGQGSFQGIKDWLIKIDHAQPRLQFKKPEALLALLNSTPAALDTFGSNLRPDAWKARPQDGQWNLTEIICHLRDVEQCVNIPRLEKIAREENPFLPGIDTDDWAREGKYSQEDGTKALQTYIRARTDLISLLKQYKETDWQRLCRHAIFGPTKLIELVEFIAIHDQTHVRQALSVL